MKVLQVLNLIPIGLLAWMVFNAIKDGSKRDSVDGYFQKLRYDVRRIRQNVNWFGVPRP